ncbi:MAG: TIGR00153 family protein [Desulfobulbaceae bacterium]|nr:TIGR00153 family protein [Desulfobulbaceae bacterium]HIJ79996.1 TIGR00153 family protein [Deltaproteobacteria bacterium]
MSLISDLFGKSPFGPLVEHSKTVHECVELIQPLLEALIREDYEEIHFLQDKISELEYQADCIKHEVREQLSKRYFMPVDKIELERFVRRQDKVADMVQDFAVILMIRNTKLHPSLHDQFFAFINQIFQVTGLLLNAAVEFQNLAEVSFSGAEARVVLSLLQGIGEEEWKADRLARTLSKSIYKLEGEEETLNIIFYEKMLLALGNIANQAENAGDILRTILVQQ